MTLGLQGKLLLNGFTLTGHADSEVVYCAAGACRIVGPGTVTGGSDGVLYRVPLPDEAAQYRIEAELLFQALAPRFAEELFAADAPGVRAFRPMYEAADARPERVAGALLNVTPQ